MGTWGFGYVDNDVAADWLLTFEERKSLKRIVTTLREFSLEESAEALAAAEVVAAFKGYPCDGFPDQLVEWIYKKPAFDLTELQNLAVEVVEEFMGALALSYSAQADQEAYRSTASNLLNRLRSPARLIALPRVPFTREVEDVFYLEFGLSDVEMSWSTNLPLKRSEFFPKPPALESLKINIQAAESVEITLNQVFSEVELECLGQWLGQYPQLTVKLNDYLTPRDVKYDPTFLRFFSKCRGVLLWLLSIKKIERVLPELSSVEYLTLYESNISSCACLNSLPNLRRLDLLNCKKLKNIHSMYSLPLAALLIDRVKGAAESLDFRAISTLRQLEIVDTLVRPEHLQGHPSLEFVRVSLQNPRDIKALLTLPKLRELILTGSVHEYKPNDLAPLMGLPSLEKFLFNPKEMSVQEEKAALEAAVGRPQVQHTSWERGPR